MSAEFQGIRAVYQKIYTKRKCEWNGGEKYSWKKGERYGRTKTACEVIKDGSEGAGERQFKEQGGRECDGQMETEGWAIPWSVCSHSSVLAPSFYIAH